MQIAPARPDTPPGPMARLIWSEDPALMRHVHRTPARWQAVLTRELPRRDTLNSHATAWGLWDNGEMLGLVSGFPAAEYLARSQATRANILHGLPDPEARRTRTALDTAETLFPAPAPDSFLVLDLSVVPAARGRGLGQRLLAHAARQARKRGCCSLSLDVVADAPALGFYQAQGWQIARQSRNPALEAAHGLGAHFQMVLPARQATATG